MFFRSSKAIKAVFLGKAVRGIIALLTVLGCLLGVENAFTAGVGLVIYEAVFETVLKCLFEIQDWIRTKHERKKRK